MALAARTARRNRPGGRAPAAAPRRADAGRARRRGGRHAARRGRRVPDPAGVPGQRADAPPVRHRGHLAAPDDLRPHAARGGGAGVRRVSRTAPARRHHPRPGAADPGLRPAGPPHPRDVRDPRHREPRRLPRAVRDAGLAGADASGADRVSGAPGELRAGAGLGGGGAGVRAGRGRHAGRPARVHARRLRDQPDPAGARPGARLAGLGGVAPARGTFPGGAGPRGRAANVPEDHRRDERGRDLPHHRRGDCGGGFGAGADRALRSAARHQHAAGGADLGGERGPAGGAGGPDRAGRLRAAVDRAGTRPTGAPGVAGGAAAGSLRGGAHPQGGGHR